MKSLINTFDRHLNNIFKWSTKEFLKAISGCFLLAFAINFFIVPKDLFNGGIIGIAQLIRSILETKLSLNFSFDIAGILNFLINIPLFIIAYKFISKTFFRRTLVCVIFQTIFLTLIPIPEIPLVKDILTSVLIGGIICGFGSGMTLSSSGSGGGTDIIGLVISMRKKNTSVGKIGATINVFIYIICGILYGITTMIYSIIYAVVTSLVVDQTHEQNICSYALVFTKNKPLKIIEFIRHELKRDATYWEGQGAYDGSLTYITYCALSKYELQRLERHINELDAGAFLIKGESIGIEGNFQKQLTK